MTKLCQVPGCGGARHARGLCITHYSRHRLGRDLTVPVRSQLKGDAAERLLGGVEYDTNGGCWLWRYATSGFGHGVIYLNRRQRRAHRVAYEAWRGTVPAGLEVCHRCDVPACVNPDHLFAGTHAENMADMAAKGRWNRAAIRRGVANGLARLTDADVVLIRREASAGRTFTDIGRRFGVSRVTVSKIVRGLGWTHVPWEIAA